MKIETRIILKSGEVLVLDEEELKELKEYLFKEDIQRPYYIPLGSPDIRYDYYTTCGGVS